MSLIGVAGWFCLTDYETAMGDLTASADGRTLTPGGGTGYMSLGVRLFDCVLKQRATSQRGDLASGLINLESPSLHRLQQ